MQAHARRGIACCSAPGSRDSKYGYGLPCVPRLVGLHPHSTWPPLGFGSIHYPTNPSTPDSLSLYPNARTSKDQARTASEHQGGRCRLAVWLVPSCSWSLATHSHPSSGPLHSLCLARLRPVLYAVLGAGLACTCPLSLLTYLHTAHLSPQPLQPS
jgi:hypothetical protein